ncbi:MAG: helix-turn-helix transcriptional regulator [Lapillicoccus sp.]
MAVPDLPSSDLIDEDPRDTISRLIAAEEDRLRTRQADLATARNALVRLHGLGVAQGIPAISPITVEVAPTLLRSLLDDTPGPVRNLAMRMDVGSALSPDLVADNQAAIRRGLEQRTLYDDSLLDLPQGQQWIADWAAVGERQRLFAGVPSEFAIYDESAVIGPGVWGDPSAEYVVIRDPMVVHVFIDLFDRLWALGSPVTSRSSDEGEDGNLLALLSRGFKDEAIARYLGWSLRTVRRRVAQLMEELGAKTRFQLGAEAVRAGRLDPPGTGGGGDGPDAYQGSGPGTAQLGRRERSG